MAKAARPTDIAAADTSATPAHDNLRAAKGIICVSLTGTLNRAIIGTIIWRFCRQ